MLFYCLTHVNRSSFNWRESWFLGLWCAVVAGIHCTDCFGDYVHCDCLVQSLHWIKIFFYYPSTTTKSHLHFPPYNGICSVGLCLYSLDYVCCCCWKSKQLSFSSSLYRGYVCSFCCNNVCAS